MKKTQTALTVITGLLFINGGLNKFFNYMPVPDDLPTALVNDFNALIEIAWLMPLIGTAEIIGGLMLLIPKTRALGLLVLTPVVVGIVLTHLFVYVNGLPIAVIIAGILSWNYVAERKKFLPLIASK